MAFNFRRQNLRNMFRQRAKARVYIAKNRDIYKAEEETSHAWAGTKVKPERSPNSLEIIETAVVGKRQKKKIRKRVSFQKNYKKTQLSKKPKPPSPKREIISSRRQILTQAYTRNLSKNLESNSSEKTDKPASQRRVKARPQSARSRRRSYKREKTRSTARLRPQSAKLRSRKIPSKTTEKASSLERQPQKKNNAKKFLNEENAEQNVSVKQPERPPLSAENKSQPRRDIATDTRTKSSKPLQKPPQHTTTKRPPYPAFPITEFRTNSQLKKKMLKRRPASATTRPRGHPRPGKNPRRRHSERHTEVFDVVPFYTCTMFIPVNKKRALEYKPRVVNGLHDKKNVQLCDVCQSSAVTGQSTIGVSVNVTNHGKWNNVFLHRNDLAKICSQLELVTVRNFLETDTGTIHDLLRSSWDKNLTHLFADCVTKRLRLDPITGAVCAKKVKVRVDVSASIAKR